MALVSSSRFASAVRLKERTDEELVRLARKGESAAFGELSDRYRGPLFNAAYRILGSVDDAKDVAQESIVKALVNLSGFDENRKFFSWIYRIAINEALDRAGRERRFVDDQAEVVLEKKVSTPETINSLEQGELRNTVHEAIQRLNANDRAVLVLHYIAEMPYAQVADTLGLPLEKVRSRLFSARRRLRLLLEDSGEFLASS